MSSYRSANHLSREFPRIEAAHRTGYARLGQRGTGLVQVIVTTAIIGVTLGVGVPKIGQRSVDMELAATKRSLANDLRRTRMDAAIGNVHFRVTLGTTSYRIERLRKLESGAWQVDSTVASRQVDLPRNVVLVGADPAGIVANIEFNTHGMVVSSTGAGSTRPVTLILNQGPSSRGDRVEVWPSGQIRLASTDRVS